MLRMLLEPRRQRTISRLVGNLLPRPTWQDWRAIDAWRTFVICMMSFITMRTMPDALWTLLWGEVSESTIRLLLRVDLFMDGFSLIPFLMALTCLSWGYQVIPQLLSADRGAGMPKLTASLIIQNAKIILIVLLIAIGVTVGKASA